MRAASTARPPASVHVPAQGLSEADRKQAHASAFKASAIGELGPARS
jgi:hypothetical protein